MLAPIKWRESACDHPPERHRSCSYSEPLVENHRCSESEPLLNSNSNSAEQNPINNSRFNFPIELFRASDLDLLLDYKYLILSSGLSIVYVLSQDLNDILPTLFTVSFNQLL
jgi:hypothetical protein